MSFAQHFNASSAALSFLANAQMIEDYTAIAVNQLNSLVTHTNATTGVKTEGILELYSDMAMADKTAIVNSGDQDAAAHTIQGISQIAGGATAAAGSIGVYAGARSFETQADNLTAPSQSGRVSAASLPIGADDAADIELGDVNVAQANPEADEAPQAEVQVGPRAKAAAEAEDTTKKENEDKATALYRKASTMRDLGAQILGGINNVAQGIGSAASAGSITSKAQYDASRAVIENTIQQLDRNFQLLMGLYQQMTQSAQLARETQGSIVAVTKS